MKSELQINDADIVDKGSKYVAMTYPWEAAVFFWDTNNLNNIADTMNNTYVNGDINKITAVCKKGLGLPEVANQLHYPYLIMEV